MQWAQVLIEVVFHHQRTGFRMTSAVTRVISIAELGLIDAGCQKVNQILPVYEAVPLLVFFSTCCMHTFFVVI